MGCWIPAASGSVDCVARWVADARPTPAHPASHSEKARVRRGCRSKRNIAWCLYLHGSSTAAPSSWNINATPSRPGARPSGLPIPTFRPPASSGGRWSVVLRASFPSLPLRLPSPAALGESDEDGACGVVFQWSQGHAHHPHHGVTGRRQCGSCCSSPVWDGRLAPISP